MKKNIKIVVVELGYVGVLNAVLLAKYNRESAVDISKKYVDIVNNLLSPTDIVMKEM